MIRIFFLFLLSVFFSGIGFSQSKPVLQTVKIDKVLTIKVPENYVPLNDDQIADKMIASRKPLLAYSSPSGTTDITVAVGNSNKNPWKDEDLKMMAQFQKANIMQLFTNVSMIQEKIVKVKGQQFAVFEFVSEVKEKGKQPLRKFHHIRYTIRRSNVLILSFICPESERGLQESLAREVMDSVRF
jgi:hypothetical protein